MNKQRRNVLHKVLDGLARLRDPVEKTEAISILNDSIQKVGDIADEEESSLDNLPESLHFSAQYENLSDNVAELFDAQGDLEIAEATCQQMFQYRYEEIRINIVEAVNKIKSVIHK